jgi:hypothetical protein
LHEKSRLQTIIIIIYRPQSLIRLVAQSVHLYLLAWIHKTGRLTALQYRNALSMLLTVFHVSLVIMICLGKYTSIAGKLITLLVFHRVYSFSLVLTASKFFRWKPQILIRSTFCRRVSIFKRKKLYIFQEKFFSFSNLFTTGYIWFRRSEMKYLHHNIQLRTPILNLISVRHK